MLLSLALNKITINRNITKSDVLKQSVDKDNKLKRIKNEEMLLTHLFAMTNVWGNRVVCWSRVVVGWENLWSYK